MQSAKAPARHSKRAPLILGLVLAALATAIGVSPALAGTVAPDNGSKVTCNYRTNSPGPAFNAKLRKIIVTPPEIFAKGGHQTVGWRLEVRRTIEEGVYPTHDVTYRSPIETATATTTRAADFDAVRLGVTLPTDVEDLRNVFYQVQIKMFWYRADGSVKSTTAFLMSQYTVNVKGNGWQYTESGYGTCDAVQWAAV